MCNKFYSLFLFSINYLFNFFFIFIFLFLKSWCSLSFQNKTSSLYVNNNTPIFFYFFKNTFFVFIFIFMFKSSFTLHNCDFFFFENETNIKNQQNWRWSDDTNLLQIISTINGMHIWISDCVNLSKRGIGLA